MDATEAKRLICATAHWLEFKRLAGFECLFGEALMLMPISEFLLGNGWQLDAERDFHSLFDGKASRGYLNYDLFATKGDERLVIEMKFLKAPRKNGGPNSLAAPLAWSRIFDDIAKLAFPTDDAKRALIVARNPKETTLPQRLKDLLEAGKTRLCFDTDGRESASQVQLSARIRSAFTLLNGPLPLKCEVEIVAEKTVTGSSVFAILVSERDAPETP